MARIPCLTAAALVALALGACTAAPADTEVDGALTRDEARALRGKTDRGIDICEWLDWYGDGVCDEFCPHPDPDCDAECRTDRDCPTIYCITTPCPTSVCVRGECVFDDPTDSCDAGERECAMCYGRMQCVPSAVSCPLLGCPPRPRCGGIAGLTCADGFFCDYDGDSCGLADQMGTCEPIPDAWIEIYAPVCGCDGVTYGNEGEAHGNGVDVSYVGPCAAPPAGCRVAGCSSQLCVDEDAPPFFTTCEWRSEYACYRTDGTCERQPTGECAWTPTEELTRCIDEARIPVLP